MERFRRNPPTAVLIERQRAEDGDRRRPDAGREEIVGRHRGFQRPQQRQRHVDYVGLVEGPQQAATAPFAADDTKWRQTGSADNSII